MISANSKWKAKYTLFYFTLTLHAQKKFSYGCNRDCLARLFYLNAYTLKNSYVINVRCPTKYEINSGYKT
jgi:hypothetical protein